MPHFFSNFAMNPYVPICFVKMRGMAGFQNIVEKMNNPFEYVPDPRCREAFRQLIDRLKALKDRGNPEDDALLSELEAGKMLGVLVAADECGCEHTLYAFSGQLGSGGFHRQRFVGPAFDYLEPGGYFKTREADISRRNAEIARFEKEELERVRLEYDAAKEMADAEIAEYKEKCRKSKAARDAKREADKLSEEEMVAMIRESQHDKAELHRLKKSLAARLEPYAEALRMARERLADMKARRRSDSESLQSWLFSNFRLLNARGETRSLGEIFAGTPLRVPPSGAGECCAPKLLQEAYLRGWRPVAIAEYWYGAPKEGEVRIHGEHYPACRGKCLPVLGWMLRGLDVEPPLDGSCLAQSHFEPKIIYENQWFCVISKPSGMLSVAGKGAAVSAEEWLRERYGAGLNVRMAHRLDQDTSGLLVATFGEESYRVMQRMFATRKVSKTYVAVLEGDYEVAGLPRKGRVSLPLSPDWLDRPRQRVDVESGKEAVTDYEFLGVSEGRSRVVFRPHTGRTHQLRVHAASAAGLGMPIAGDRLYGRKSCGSRDRLLLHALQLEFTFPLDGNRYSFEDKSPF